MIELLKAINEEISEWLLDKTVNIEFRENGFDCHYLFTFGPHIKISRVAPKGLSEIEKFQGEYKYPITMILICDSDLVISSHGFTGHYKKLGSVSLYNNDSLDQLKTIILDNIK